jgi:hypothetical protein
MEANDLPVRKPARVTEARIPKHTMSMDRWWTLNVEGMPTVTHATKAEFRRLRDDAEAHGLAWRAQFVDVKGRIDVRMSGGPS